MDTQFIQLASVLAIAMVVALLMQVLKQPLIIGHMITGVLVGPHMLSLVHDSESLHTFGNIGVALLLFIIGISLNPRVIKEVGTTAVVTGVSQMLIAILAAFGIARLFGLGTVEAAYVGFALSLSSTIVVLKVLSDRRELASLHGKIATGFLLVQDIAAAIFLVGLTAANQEGNTMAIVYRTLLGGTVLFAGYWFVTHYLLASISRLFARSQEFLLLFSVGWGFGMATLFKLAGFSLEVGALFAGVALAASPYSLEIAAKLRPLRDFFIIPFFILIGADLGVQIDAKLIAAVIVLTFFVLLVKPLLIMGIMGRLGYRKDTSFRAGITVGQVSEFSLIIVAAVLVSGQLSQSVATVITLVTMITIAVSAYSMTQADQLLGLLKPFLGWIERAPKSAKREKKIRAEHPSVVIFGYRKGGFHFVQESLKLGEHFLVVDFDPEVIAQLETRGIACQYGDATNTEFLAELELDSVQVVISNLTSFSVNTLLTSYVAAHAPQTICIVTCDDVRESIELYRLGATYVIMPHYLGGTKVSTLFDKHGYNEEVFALERSKHLKYLEHRLSA